MVDDARSNRPEPAAAKTGSAATANAAEATSAAAWGAPKRNSDRSTRNAMNPSDTSHASAIAAGARNRSGLGTGSPSQPRPTAVTNTASTTTIAQHRTAQLKRQPLPMTNGSAAAISSAHPNGAPPSRPVSSRSASPIDSPRLVA